MNNAIAFDTLEFNLYMIFSLVRGFATGTAVIQGDSFVTCYNSFENFVSKIQEVINDWQYEVAKYEGFEFEDFDLWPYLLIDWKQIDIIYSIHGMVNGCYYGAFEAWGVLEDYT